LTAPTAREDCERVGIRVLGALTVDGSGELGRRDRVVLASLATSPGHPVSADQLSDALWGDRPPASAGKILQGCVVRIRKVLGREAVQTSPHGYALHLPAEDVDSLRFEDQVGRARELLTLGEADRAAYLLTDALALWHGEAFADLESWEPAVAAGTRLFELRLEALPECHDDESDARPEDQRGRRNKKPSPHGRADVGTARGALGEPRPRAASRPLAACVVHSRGRTPCRRQPRSLGRSQPAIQASR
jgi:hypothetical protein